MNGPISSNCINGHVRNTKNTQVITTGITVVLDAETAWALCNLLLPDVINKNEDRGQRTQMLNLGSAIGALIGHPSKDNLIVMEEK